MQRNELTTKRYTVGNNNANDATHLLDLEIGTNINYNSDVLNMVEHDTIAQVTADVQARGLTVTEPFLQSIAETDEDGNPNPDWAELRQGLGIPLVSTLESEE